MFAAERYQGGENFDLRKMLMKGKNLRLNERVQFFDGFLRDLENSHEGLCMRRVVSAADREVTVLDPYSQQPRTMLMFGSNNYLGLANHPYVREHVQKAIKRYGVGIGGPPLLNGYTRLHRELEERLAALKGTEDALIFSSGYGANVGLVSGLMNAGDTVLYDGYSHASFCDGIKLASGVQSFHFPHNDMKRLQHLLKQQNTSTRNDLYVGVEGVYSMDGDTAPLDVLVPQCKSHGAMLILDDAHGTGVMGATGRGTAEFYDVDGQIDITMGTFSKAFAVTGGFVAASKPVIDYLRYFARSYMFSASLSPTTIATVLAGLDVIELEPELLTKLHDTINYAANGLRVLGFDVEGKTAIIPLRVPVGMNIRRAAYKFHERGLFLNSIEYPAVPLSQQRFRISMMATHTLQDINHLLEAVAEVWAEFNADQSSEHFACERTAA
jgi:glycine C-acetyltransferase